MRNSRIEAMRSLLFVPGDSERKMQRGLVSGADALILDLEDSVSESQKHAARTSVSAFLKALPLTRSQRYLVRVNSMASEHFHAALNSIAEGGPDGVVLPKSEPAQVRSLSRQLTVLEKANGLTIGSI